MRYEKIDWSDKDALLTAMYPTIDNAVIAEKIGATVSALRSRATKLKLKKTLRYWSDEDNAWLLANYNATGIGLLELMNHFPTRTKWAIINQYRELTGARKK